MRGAGQMGKLCGIWTKLKKEILIFLDSITANEYINQLLRKTTKLPRKNISFFFPNPSYRPASLAFSALYMA